MLYSEIVELYDLISSTTKKLEKIDIISKFLPKIKGNEEFIYLLKGRVFPDYDPREMGISTQLIIKAISLASGFSTIEVNSNFKKIGDLGNVAYELLKKKKQNSLFSKKLTVSYVMDSLRKLSSIAGDGSVDKKISTISELLIEANSKESCYIVRTILGDLRIGVFDASILGAINKASFGDASMLEKIERAYDLVNDFAQILKLSNNGKDAFEHIALIPGRPLNVMLATKVQNVEEAFDVCGRPAAFEHKYDGFRVIVSHDGKKVRLFTRRLEEVTNQFPDVIDAVSKHVNAKNFILDAEAVGFDSKKNKYLPFEAISQRIKRKYGIEELSIRMPVELKVFDIIYLNGENKLDIPFRDRRKIIEKIIENVAWKISVSTQIVTDSDEEVEKFYHDALNIGEEGIMIKNLNSTYISGRYVGNMAKLKPTESDLDLVIVGAEYGTGKRAGGLTSFIVACKSAEKFLEVGKVSSGLKEKEGEGTTYNEINALLQPLIISENEEQVKVKPKLVVSVTYQNIQPSPTYSSGFALRFPRITHYRPERGIHDIATLEDIKREISKMGRKLAKKG